MELQNSLKEDYAFRYLSVEGPQPRHSFHVYLQTI